jgi:hypothetical protein
MGHSSAPIPQHDARRLLLAAVAGLGREAASSFIELRFRRPGEPMRQAFYPCRDVASVGARAAVLAGENDVYAACAPRTRRFGGADAVERVWMLWADLDSPDAMGRLDAFEPAPSFVVASGSPGGHHAWWPLNRPLRPDHARVALRRLAHTLGADIAAAEPARILRLPGTLNHKHDPPSPVECTRLELDSYHAREIVGELPDPPERRPAVATAPRPLDTDDPLRSMAASEYVALLGGHRVGSDGKALCPLPGHDERTPSFHAYATPEAGWYCYGCGRGGTIVDFGAHLYGIEPRGRGFHEVRRRLAADLLASVRGELAA